MVVSAGPTGEKLEPLERAAGVRSPEHEVPQSRTHAAHRAHETDRRRRTRRRGLARTDLTVPPAHFVDFGLRFALEPISDVRKGSPADIAGFRPGDRIKKVDGDDDIDPLRLPELCCEKAGKPMTFVVERPVAGGEPPHGDAHGDAG